MKIEIKKVITTVPLKEYAEEYGSEALHVWVNPPRATTKQREDLDNEYMQRVGMQLKSEKNREERMQKAEGEKAQQAILKENTAENERFQAWLQEWNQRSFAWFAYLWSQAADESTHWTVEEIGTLFEQEPTLTTWLAERTHAALQEQRDKQKKS